MGGSYILAELDGTISKLQFATFRLIPYHPCDIQAIPVTKITDVTLQQLEDLTYNINTTTTSKVLSLDSLPPIPLTNTTAHPPTLHPLLAMHPTAWEQAGYQ
ncbi:hypothetical protein P691DRAFT_769019 [Macrolepiota fuliginosa MF-IS2]|uniref:Uncharacterized protein n=1 Tax=Macrolepiota fuliginosa MF-IS2 TaxID=1400762 RepID=A0A9P6BUU8_9AGAR|nr:hypothetical protein P691DRAFT_769019 [Macrolepiota fuliginosa MF-IS2]